MENLGRAGCGPRGVAVDEGSKCPSWGFHGVQREAPVLLLRTRGEIQATTRSIQRHREAAEAEAAPEADKTQEASGPVPAGSFGMAKGPELSSRRPADELSCGLAGASVAASRMVLSSVATEWLMGHEF